MKYDLRFHDVHDVVGCLALDGIWGTDGHWDGKDGGALGRVSRVIRREVCSFAKVECGWC